MNHVSKYESGKASGFDIVDVRDSAKVEGISSSVNQAMIVSTPFTAEIDGKTYPVYGYAETTLQRDKKILDEAQRHGEMRSVELYVDMRDDVQRLEKPTIKNYCPEGCKNLEDLGVDSVSHYGRNVTTLKASADMQRFGVDASFVPHVYEFDEFKDVREKTVTPDLVRRGFLDDATVTGDDYNKYVGHCVNQLNEGIPFTGRIKSSNIHEAYESCPENLVSHDASSDRSIVD